MTDVYTPRMSDTRHEAAGEKAQEAVHRLASRPALRADDAIEATRRATQDALDTMHDGAADLRQPLPSAFSRGAQRAEELARQGIERARATGSAVREQAHRAGDATRHYIQDEPVKSVLIAAAAGAAVAGLIGWLGSRQRHWRG